MMNLKIQITKRMVQDLSLDCLKSAMQMNSVCIFLLFMSQQIVNAENTGKHVKYHLDKKYHSAKIQNWAVKLQASDGYSYYSNQDDHKLDMVRKISSSIVYRLNTGILSNTDVRASMLFSPMEYLRQSDIYLLELRLSNIPDSSAKDSRGATEKGKEEKLKKTFRLKNDFMRRNTSVSRDAKVRDPASSQNLLRISANQRSVIKTPRGGNNHEKYSRGFHIATMSSKSSRHSKSAQNKTLLRGNNKSNSNKSQTKPAAEKSFNGDNQSMSKDILDKNESVEIMQIYSNSSLNLDELSQAVHRLLDDCTEISWYSQQVIRPRVKRSLTFQDPAYPQQWHLYNTLRPHMDINVQDVWDRNITGHGVTVVVVDDGLEWTNPDILDNYSPQGSWDLNSHDSNPMPEFKKEKNHHGTRCAGEIAAVANSVCAVGVAFQAKIAGIRVLDGPMTDSLEATAFNKNMEINDIYSCSWGPDDDGKTVDGPHILAQTAMEKGVNYGRQGYGSIYVVASGNGGNHGDNCNFDGYANSVYTVTIGAVDETGAMPYYAEECASMFAVTFSSGGVDSRNVVTTDWMKHGGTGCTNEHSGTSAAAPLAAGMIALMLQTRPCLTWRDIQHIIVMTAVKVDEQLAHFSTNKAGLHHSHKHGFGLMDAWRLVNVAKVWDPVPWMSVYSSPEVTVHVKIPRYPQVLELNITVSENVIAGYDLFMLEHSQVTLTLNHPHRGSLEIHIICPSGTESVIATPRPKDSSSDGYQGWTFSTVRCWGESPVGTWKLIVTDKGRHMVPLGKFEKWQLVLFGSQMNRENLEARKRLIEDAVTGKYLRDDYTKPCPPPPVIKVPEASMPPRTLKILLLIGVFCLLIAIYDTFEYMFCYNDEKKAALLQPGSQGNGTHSNQGVEYTRLLSNAEENIPMVEMPRNVPGRISHGYHDGSCDNSFHDNSYHDDRARLTDRGQFGDKTNQDETNSYTNTRPGVEESDLDGDLGMGSSPRSSRSSGNYSYIESTGKVRNSKNTGSKKAKKLSKLSMGRFEEVSLLSSPDGDISE